MDFSTDALYITLPADEGIEDFQFQFHANINITNDDINEADREFFIVYLSITQDTLPGLLLNSVVSVGGIDDDDHGKSNNSTLGYFIDKTGRCYLSMSRYSIACVVLY